MNEQKKRKTEKREITNENSVYLRYMLLGAKINGFFRSGSKSVPLAVLLIIQSMRGRRESIAIRTEIMIWNTKWLNA